MADTNQINNKGLLESEFKNVLKLYTETILKEDSTLPPQNKAVYEAIKEVEDKVNLLEQLLTQRIDQGETNLISLRDILSNRFDTFNSNLDKAINLEVDRAKQTEANLSDRIDTEKERLDVFLNGEDIEGTAIDTLKEIQRWINDDEVGTAELIIRVGNTETKLEDEIADREQAIIDLSNNMTDSLNSEVEVRQQEVQKLQTNLETETSNREKALGSLQETFEEALSTESTTRAQEISNLSSAYQKADTELDTKLMGVSDRVELLEREVVLISCGNSKF